MKHTARKGGQGLSFAFEPCISAIFEDVLGVKAVKHAFNLIELRFYKEPDSPVLQKLKELAAEVAGRSSACMTASMW